MHGYPSSSSSSLLLATWTPIVHGPASASHTYTSLGASGEREGAMYRKTRPMCRWMLDRVIYFIIVIHLQARLTTWLRLRWLVGWRPGPSRAGTITGKNGWGGEPFSQTTEHGWCRGWIMECGRRGWYGGETSRQECSIKVLLCCAELILIVRICRTAPDIGFIWNPSRATKLIFRNK